MPSREKGSVAELEVARLISGWWNQLEPTAIFRRTPLSGGWGTPDVRSAFRTAGDIMTDSLAFPFAVEVKRREGFSWKPLLDGKKSPVWGWWRQAQKQGEEMNLVPTLWFRKNREPWHVLLPVYSVTSHLGGFEPFVIPIAQRWSRLMFVDYGKFEPVMVTGADFLKLDPQRALDRMRKWIDARMSA